MFEVELDGSLYRFGSSQRSIESLPVMDIQHKIERSNMVNLTNASIKMLLDVSVSGRDTESVNSLIKELFIVVEQSLSHGLKVRRGLITSRISFWAFLEAVEPAIPTMRAVLDSVREMSSLKTCLGRGRAWIRLSFIRKELADFLKSFSELCTDQLRECYEPYSVMRNEELGLISGLIMGLHAFDYVWDLKCEELDNQINVCDLSYFIRSLGLVTMDTVDKCTEDENCSQNSAISGILDQKAYLEEVNKTLSVTAMQQQQKVESLQMKVGQLTAEVQRLKTCSDVNRLSSRTDNAFSDADVVEVLETETEDSGILSKLKQVLRHEINLRKEAECLLEERTSFSRGQECIISSLKAESLDKQDMLEGLRRQIDDIKKINIELHKKRRELESSGQTHKENTVRLETQMSKLMARIREMEEIVVLNESSRAEALTTVQTLQSKLTDKENDRRVLETTLQIERDWRSGLQADYEQLEKKLNVASIQLKELDRVKKENLSLQSRLQELEATCLELEEALEEVGMKLSHSQLRMDEMKEISDIMQGKVWKDDKTVTNCQQCSNSFSLSRRKHHCRNCGGIFCGICSDNWVVLQDGKRPVRVCDHCSDKLIHKATVLP